MSRFGHLCRECLDVPSQQCGYRFCPVRLGAVGGQPAPQGNDGLATQAAGAAPAAFAGANSDGLATQYADPVRRVSAQPVAAPTAEPAKQDRAPSQNDRDSLQTKFVTPTTQPLAPLKMPPVAANPVPRGNPADDLATRYVSPTNESKR